MFSYVLEFSVSVYERFLDRLNWLCLRRGSDMAESSVSKASKKNQKRAQKRAQERAQKLKEDGVIDRLLHENDDPVEKLKTQLQEAKDNKDHKLAAKLRKDLWIMQDQMAGLPPGDQMEPSEPPDTASDQNDLATSLEVSHSQTPEKKLRNLKKKLQQIQTLREKQEKGEDLEELQIAKVQSEEAILQEISELQEVVKETNA